MDSTLEEMIQENQILQRMVEEEKNLQLNEERAKKQFKISDISRVLLKVERPIAIGGIIKSGLFKKESLSEDLDDLLDSFFNVYFPNFVYNFVKKILPGFVEDLKILIVVFVFRWLYYLPGDVLEFDVPEHPQDEISQDDLPKFSIDDLRKFSGSQNKRIDFFLRKVNEVHQEYRHGHDKFYRLGWDHCRDFYTRELYETFNLFRG